MKHFLKISVFLLLSNLHFAHASVIEIPADAYFSDVSVSEGGSGLDWAWASPVNVEFWTGYIGSSKVGNQLCRPSEIYVSELGMCIDNDDGWRFASPSEITYLKDELNISNFYNDDLDEYIQATQYWNTALVHIDIDNFKSDDVSSEWEIDNNINDMFYPTGWNDETFYVRDQTTGEPVPEPSVFALLLIAAGLLWTRRKAIQIK